MTAFRQEEERARNEAASDRNGSVFLNAGDFFQGNAWYSLFKWEVVAPFTNLLNFTAMVSCTQRLYYYIMPILLSHH